MSPTLTLRGNHKIPQVSRCHGPHSKMLDMWAALRSQIFPSCHEILQLPEFSLHFSGKPAREF